MPRNKPEPKDRRFTCVWQCGICVAVCGENAISRGSEIFTIDLKACSVCMLCAKACPAGMIGEDLFA